MTDDYDKVFGNKQKIMVVFAHPDDAEVFAGGTIARLIGDDKEVMVIKMTSGNKGSRDMEVTEEELMDMREKEDLDSMNTLGVKKENSVYLRIGDGTIEDNLDTIGKVAKQIRLFHPDIIITHNPENTVIRFDKETSWVNHRDHRNTGQVVLDAAYPYSRDLLFYPEHFKEDGAKSHKVSQFLLVDYYGHEDTVHIDMTDFVDTRVKAHAMHKSQYTEDAVKETADFFTKNEAYGEKRFERFRYVVAD